MQAQLLIVPGRVNTHQRVTTDWSSLAEELRGSAVMADALSLAGPAYRKDSEGVPPFASRDSVTSAVLLCYCVLPAALDTKSLHF